MKTTINLNAILEKLRPLSDSDKRWLADRLYEEAGLMRKGHAYVDMGLSVRWATCNVGASFPEEPGDYYAWGETETKSSYTSDNCATWEEEIGDIGGTSRDVAHVKWGGSWRMPTDTEFRELLSESNCTWEWTVLDGHKGCKVRSKKTGNSIFLPAAGWRIGTSLRYAGEDGYYWSSRTFGHGAQDAEHQYFCRDGRDTPYRNGLARWFGLPIRPVSRMEEKEELGSTINGHAYVDMGLSVRWATCNVGASFPEEYGDYYAWGETQTKLNYTDDNCETYKKVIGDIGGTSRDVAHVKWGGGWRMPTKAEFDELFNANNCSWTWTKRNGVKGCVVKSKKTGNRIFLPAAGWRDETFFYDDGKIGYYWSSSPKESNAWYATQYAACLSVSRSVDDRGTCGMSRQYGGTVRPVVEF